MFMNFFSFPVATQTLTHDCFTQAPSYVVLAALCAKECKLNLKCNCNACANSSSCMCACGPGLPAALLQPREDSGWGGWQMPADTKKFDIFDK